MTVRVAVDALGGDRGPEAIVEGALEAAADGSEPILFGPAGLDTQGLELVPTTQEIAMDEKPAEAVRSSRTARSSQRAVPLASGGPMRSSRPGTRARCWPLA